MKLGWVGHGPLGRPSPSSADGNLFTHLSANAGTLALQKHDQVGVLESVPSAGRGRGRPSGPRPTNLIATNTNIATQRTTSRLRKLAAVPMVTPRPVARATYAATQAGHFGSNNSVALGTSQPAISPPTCHRVTDLLSPAPPRDLI
jgi:hypothetical protein